MTAQPPSDDRIGHVSNEVSGEALSRAQLRPIIRRAKTHWQTLNRVSLLFAAELRQLHEGGAHLEYGYDEFGEFAEGEFPGLSAASARKLSRTGDVLLTLQRHRRLVVAEGDKLPIGTRAARALASIQFRFGGEAMLAVYDRAVETHPAHGRPGKPISDRHVQTAQRDLFPPPSVSDRSQLVSRAPVSPPAAEVEQDAPEVDDEEPLDPSAVPEVLQQFVTDIDRELLGEWDGPLSPEVREDAEHALRALEVRLERVGARLRSET